MTVPGADRTLTGPSGLGALSDGLYGVVTGLANGVYCPG